ncbi:hypothetical protein CLOM_g20956, partial [Closterium sp. NIES-68]
GPSVTL